MVDDVRDVHHERVHHLSPGPSFDTKVARDPKERERGQEEDQRRVQRRIVGK
jgi:hypothetical protein